MNSGRYLVGIDLGTTHTALACVDRADASPQPRIRTLEIPQTVRPGHDESRTLLPSCIYLPAEKELPEGSLALPWSERPPRTESGAEYTVGEFARARGAEVPTRLIASAKSWLCQPGIDRRAVQLPCNAPPNVPRVTPVEASSLILRHLASAWLHAMRHEPNAGALKDQKIVLCVPASFDATARDMTLEAARLAGFIDVTLLEEPQAAFYAWIAQSNDEWRKQVRIGDRVLIVDIGGGTTDFSLIAVDDERGALSLRRIAIGEHILLGGDNMDLALADSVAARLARDGVKLDPWQLRGLALACCEAKERLLNSKRPAPAQPIVVEPPVPIPIAQASRASQSAAVLDPNAPACRYTKRRSKKQKAIAPAAPRIAAPPAPRTDVPIAVLGRGIGVVGTSIRAAIEPAEAERLIIDGFLAPCSPSARPRQSARFGLREIGLGYAADPSIAKHLAQFLARENSGGAQPENQEPETRSQKPSITAILFNGGVMKSELLRRRTTDIVREWIQSDGGPAPREICGTELELAVARGAAYYGLVQQGKGVRIKAGSPRSYYIGIEPAQPAVPGRAPRLKALCVAPFGMDEGAESVVPGAEFGIAIGEPAQFRFFVSTARRADKAGDAVEISDPALTELDPIETTLAATRNATEGKLVPVKLHVKMIDAGVIELRFRESNGEGEWKLAAVVRER